MNTETSKFIQRYCRSKGAGAAGGFEISDIRQEHRALQNLFGGQQVSEWFPIPGGW